MNTTKKIIAVAIILGLAIISFILFGTQNNNKTANSTTSSTVSSVISKVSEMSQAVIKDNKTLELTPKNLSIWSSNNSDFQDDVINDTSFPGVKGYKEYSYPLVAGEGVTDYLVILNSNMITNESSKTELKYFKDLIAKTVTPSIDGYSRIYSMFRNTGVGGAPSNLVNDISYPKPANFDTMRITLSRGGITQSNTPAIEILGSRGNDYFVYRRYLNNINEYNYPQKFAEAQKECNSDTAFECIGKSYDDRLKTTLGSEILNKNITEMLSLIN